MKIVKQLFDISTSNRKEKERAKSKGSALIDSSQSRPKDGGRGQGGLVVLIPEEAEDIWILYNLMAKGDRMRCITSRKVTAVLSDTGASATELKKISLTIKVETLDYDGEGDSLRVSGIVTSENQHGVNLGSHHTMQLRLNMQVSIGKGNWDSRSRSLLSNAASGRNTAETIVVLLDSGIANMYLLTPSLEKPLTTLRANIPKRRANSASHDNAEKRFFESVAKALENHVTQAIKVVILGGPGFTKDTFLSYVTDDSIQRTSKFVTNRKLYLLVDCSAATKQALKEVMTHESVKSRVTNLASAINVKGLETLYKTLQNDPHRACYGPAHCKFAVERGAVKTLMITDSLFRSSSTSKRREYIRLTETVEQSGGEVLVFSEKHTSGEQLSKLTGIACVLRYPLSELEEIDVSASNWQMKDSNNKGEESDTAVDMDEIQDMM